MTKRRSFLALIGTFLITSPFKSFGRVNRKNQDMDAKFYTIAELAKKQKEGTSNYLPFLNTDKLSTGLYVLPKGATDGQQPHTKDEVYYILSGKGKFLAGEETTEVKEGAVLYVKTLVEHRFFDIEEELKILVFFSNMA